MKKSDKNEKKMMDAIMDIAKIINKYKIRGFCCMGYPDLENTTAIVAGDPDFAGYCMVNGVKAVVGKYKNTDDCQYFLGKLILEALEYVARLPNNEGDDLLEKLRLGLNDYKKAKAAEAAAGPKYEN